MQRFSRLCWWKRDLRHVEVFIGEASIATEDATAARLRVGYEGKLRIVIVGDTLHTTSGLVNGVKVVEKRYDGFATRDSTLTCLGCSGTVAAVNDEDGAIVVYGGIWGKRCDGSSIPHWVSELASSCQRERCR